MSWTMRLAGIGALSMLLGAGAPPTQSVATNGAARIEVLAQGSGPTIVILPSLGRGAADYDQFADLLVEKGFRVLRPQPRGIGGSTGPMTDLTMHDYAADVAAVITQEAHGPVIVVGHAFGNFVARMLATDHPALVAKLVLAAASPGKLPPGEKGPVIAPDISTAIDESANPALPETERLKALQAAFFAPGNDPRVWLGGWHPEAMAAERAAEKATSADAWFAGGQAPILLLQAAEDAVAPLDQSSVLKDALGDRVAIVLIAHAGHALVPEQPAAVVEAITDFARLP
jgi:pimeloyl-ACP methyl ester carboxylesterase